MELIDNAKEELKRSDHLIYVSLKYTRTCDIIMNTIKRMIEAFDFLNLALLEHLKDKKKIPNVPEGALNRTELLEKHDKKYRNYMKLYTLLTKIASSEFDRREEYRKNVTLISHLDKKDLEITVPMLQEYFEKTKEFVGFVESEIS